jgi:hypothetical protein
VLAAAFPTAALAGGGGGGFVVSGPLSGPGAHAVTADVKLTGSITVDFHGDEASGCAAAHLCDLSGRVRFDASGPGQIFAIAERRGGKSFESGFMYYADAFEPNQLQTSARVRRTSAPGSVCADGAVNEEVSSNSDRRHGTALELRLLDLPGSQDGTSEILRTRCAGPSTADIAALLPARRVTERQLLRGHRTLDFSADRQFAVHGLAGTVHSNVTLRILDGRRDRLNSGGSGFPRGWRKVRRRTLIAEYRVERVNGSVVTSVRGRGDPDLCGPLDACGLTGSVTTAPAATSGTASIEAIGSARRSRMDLRRALGLSPGPRPRSVARYGSVFWDRDSGSVTSDLTRDGAPACADSLPIGGGGGLELGFTGGRVRAGYGAVDFGVTDLVQTHCPGPVGADVPAALATVEFPLSVFRHRRVTLHLTRGAGYRSPGYSGRTTPDVTVVLRRTRIRSFVYTTALPPDFAGGGHVRSLR